MIDSMTIMTKVLCNKYSLNPNNKYNPSSSFSWYSNEKVTLIRRYTFDNNWITQYIYINEEHAKMIRKGCIITLIFSNF
jgi:hypothetical protein